MATIKIGAPSLKGKSAFATIQEAFGNAKFPISVTFTNLCPRDISLPEIRLFLKNVCAPHGTSKTVTVYNLAELQRAVSSILKIAELNRYPEALELECSLPEEAEVVKETPRTTLEVAVDNITVDSTIEITKVPKEEVQEEPKSEAPAKVTKTRKPRQKKTETADTEG